MVIDEGVDPEWAAAQAALGSFANAGQICVSVERIYLHSTLTEPFLAALTRRRTGGSAGSARSSTGHSGRTCTTTSPTPVRRSADPHRWVAPDGPGRVLPADRAHRVQPGMAVMREETFGPVAPVRVVPDFRTALREAGDDGYGLAATVLTPDMAHAQEAWRELPVGTVKINDVFGGAPGGAANHGGAADRDTDTDRSCSTR